jgi:hypothetical protein
VSNFFFSWNNTEGKLLATDTTWTEHSGLLWDEIKFENKEFPRMGILSLFFFPPLCCKKRRKRSSEKKVHVVLLLVVDSRRKNKKLEETLLIKTSSGVLLHALHGNFRIFAVISG